MRKKITDAVSQIDSLILYLLSLVGNSSGIIVGCAPLPQGLEQPSQPMSPFKLHIGTVIYIYMFLSIYLSIYPSIYPSIHLGIFQSIYIRQRATQPDLCRAAVPVGHARGCQGMHGSGQSPGSNHHGTWRSHRRLGQKHHGTCG